MYLDFTSNPVHAGFPSPTEDFIENRLDLNRALVKNPSSTFYARVSGDGMADDGVDDGDILVVDKSVSFYNGCLAVCVIDGEFTLKRIKIEKEGNDFRIWGVVRYIIKKV